MSTPPRPRGPSGSRGPKNWPPRHPGGVVSAHAGRVLPGGWFAVDEDLGAAAREASEDPTGYARARAVDYTLPHLHDSTVLVRLYTWRMLKPHERLELARALLARVTPEPLRPEDPAGDLTFRQVYRLAYPLTLAITDLLASDYPQSGSFPLTRSSYDSTLDPTLSTTQTYSVLRGAYDPARTPQDNYAVVRAAAGALLGGAPAAEHVPTFRVDQLATGSSWSSLADAVVSVDPLRVGLRCSCRHGYDAIPTWCLHTMAVWALVSGFHIPTHLPYSASGTPLIFDEEMRVYLLTGELPAQHP